MENQNHDDKRGELQALEGRVGELERIAESLGDTPDEEVVAALDRAVSLLDEINADVQSSLQSANEEVRELGGILDGLSLLTIHEALEDQDKPERHTQGPY